MSQAPPMRETEGVRSDNPKVTRAEAVRSYFGESRNYLDVRRYMIEIRKETVREVTAGRTFHDILDIGCGDGSISIPFLRPAVNLTLLDLSDAMLARALSAVPDQLLSNVKTIKQDFLTTELQPGSFDLVICVGVLAHVESPEQVIKKVSQLLRPGGFVILECTDCANFTNKLTVMLGQIRGAFKTVKSYRTKLVNAESVLHLADQNGLKLLCMYRHNVALPLMGKVFSQNTLQKFIRAIFGNASGNRNAFLGKECLFAFELGPQGPQNKS